MTSPQFPYLAPLLADDLDLVVADALQLAAVVPLLAHAVRLVLGSRN